MEVTKTGADGVSVCTATVMQDVKSIERKIVKNKTLLMVLYCSALALDHPSAVEYRPADFVSQALVIDDQSANLIRELFTLPPALEPAGNLFLTIK